MANSQVEKDKTNVIAYMGEHLLEQVVLDKKLFFDVASFRNLLKGKNNAVVLFGAGNLGKSVLKTLKLIGIKPVAFLDDTPQFQNTVIEEIPVVSPETAAKTFGPDLVVIVCICNANHRFTKAQKRFNDLGFYDVYSFSSLIHSFPGVFKPYYVYDTGDVVKDHITELSAIYSLLADENSKQTLLSHIQFRVSNNFSFVPLPEEDLYFPQFIRNKLSSETHFVDCGAYIGDTLELFRTKYRIYFDRITAFVPDQYNFKRLKESVQCERIDKVTLLNKAVGYKNGFFAFTETGSEGSSLTENGTIKVQVESLQNVIDNHNTYVKFDIEGSELEAIKGAESAIAKYKPVLAVSAYHKSDDLWTIPNLLKGIHPDYNISLTTEGEDGLGLVYYAY